LRKPVVACALIGANKIDLDDALYVSGAGHSAFAATIAVPS
jgi:hypothetical protein